MGYDFHIERADGGMPISLGEWQAAVDATEGVRLFAAAAQSVTNPKTGDVVWRRAREGDTEVFFPDRGEWHLVFSWSRKSSSFKASFDPTNTSHPVWRAAVALATRLGAVICGDQGEVYDFETGEVVDPDD